MYQVNGCIIMWIHVSLSHSNIAHITEEGREPGDKARFYDVFMTISCNGVYRSVNCPQHTEEQRQSLRRRLLCE